MSLFQQHFWSLYLDFIDEFKVLDYKGILLPLLCDFSELLKGNENLVQEMKNPAFKNNLKNCILSDSQIQPLFDRYIQKMNCENPENRKSGKILLYEYVLRFPNTIIKKYFDPSMTVILRNQMNLRKNKVISTIYIDHYKKDISEQVKIYEKQIKETISSPNSHPIFRKYKNLIEKFKGMIPELVKNLAAIDRLFDEVPISCVIVGTTEDSVSRTIVAAASSKGVPSICMQHGLIIREESFLPVFSTVHAVYGKYEREWYINKGVLENQIEIVGHPRFDEMFIRRQNVRSHIKLPQMDLKKKRILIATQPNTHLMCRKLLDQLVEDSSFEIIIRPHPIELYSREYLNYKLDISKYTTVKLLLPSNLHLYDVLATVDTVVVFNSSTVGLEAILFGKPVIILTNDSKNDYFNKLGEFVQSDPSKVSENIKKVLNNLSFKEYYEIKRNEFLSFAYPQNLSGFCLLELIHNLTNEGK